MRGVVGHPTVLPYLETANEEYSKLCEGRNMPYLNDTRYGCSKWARRRAGIRLFLYFAGKRGARPAGFEPATRGLEVRCSVLLSYGRNEQKCCKAAHFSGDSNIPRCLMAAVGQQ